MIAGPGSGKTRVLAARAADLVLSRGVQPWQIMALTFTNKAGDEMKDRLASVVGAELADGMVAGACGSRQQMTNSVISFIQCFIQHQNSPNCQYQNSKTKSFCCQPYQIWPGGRLEGDLTFRHKDFQSFAPTMLSTCGLFLSDWANACLRV